MRGVLANDLFVAVRSSLDPVAKYLTGTRRFGLDAGPVAAEVLVVQDPSAPAKRFYVEEYYTRIVWLDATHAEVETNGAKGRIEWSGAAHDLLRAELRIFPEGAPESLGLFLRLLTSLLLPARRGLLIHASSVIVEGQALVFLGDSGAGKTTTARRAGRNGALRIADDLAILHVDSDETAKVTVEPCRFDTGGRLPGRAGGSWPLRAAYDLRKGAAATEDLGAVNNPLAVWCAAIVSSTGPPTSLDSLLSLAVTLGRTNPPRALNVCPSGPVVSALTAPALHQLHASSLHR